MTVARRRLPFLLAAVVLAIGLLLGGAVVGSPAEVADRDRTREASGATAASGTVEALQARLTRLPGDHAAWARLGLLYVDRARVTGDPSWYGKAQAAVDRSLHVLPDGNADALTALATLQAAQHDFSQAAETARAALAVNEYDATAYGVLTDALTELGRYDEAAEALQRMADLDPDFAALTRISYARELRGDVDGAEQAMQQALSAAGTPADAGFALLHLGELAWSYGGDVETASDLYARGLAYDPSSIPLQAASARAAAAAGRTGDAVAGYAKVSAGPPVQQYLVEQAELLEHLGRQQEADDSYDLVRAAVVLLRASGSVADLETALFEADHGSAAVALTAARAAYQRAPSVFAADALAWALHVSGRSAEALPLADEALALGGRPASFLFHRGMIAAALGRDAEAAHDLKAALETNPRFSLPHSATARTTLARLER